MYLKHKTNTLIAQKLNEIQLEKNTNNTGCMWYRFGGGVGIKMPTSCVPDWRCRTHATGWMNGTHPTVADGKVTRNV